MGKKKNITNDEVKIGNGDASEGRKPLDDFLIQTGNDFQEEALPIS
jgi:hypothetical protein